MDLPKLWTEITTGLQRARSTLPSDATGHAAICEYEEFLKHNELELACDMLELYAENHVASEAFWIALRDAAAKMGSSDRARRYEEFASGR